MYMPDEISEVKKRLKKISRKCDDARRNAVDARRKREKDSMTGKVAEGGRGDW